jgi:uncharacterized 2Fe-2S/4Fe-4S cluster protein (DUF4445 family)
MRYYKITFNPDEKTKVACEGMTIIEAANEAGISLQNSCGSQGICGKCAVIIDAKEVLACQYKVKSDVVVTIPAASRQRELKILEEGIDRRSRIEPDLYQKHANIAGDGRILGLAADIGTTTVVVKLIDMKSRECIGTESAINPQTRYGDDVISRINYASTKRGLAELHSLIIECLNELTGRLCRKGGVDRKEIYEASIVGNTTMNHLFLKMPVRDLGQAPYRAYNVQSQQLYPSELGIQINPHGNIFTVANIASFVGSDTTAAALAAGLGDTNEKTLLVDIGTNGEVVLGSRERLLTTSCAAGPAFEGAQISSGSRAVEGAIEACLWNGENLEISVIGNGMPRSICGSGLIDALATFVELGIIDSTGRIIRPNNLSKKLSAHIIDAQGQPAIVIGEGERRVLLTQNDVRKLQLAKAAIRAGIRILQKELGWQDEDIEQVFLAGAFGNCIRKASAVRIGLLPALPLKRIHFIGNAACSGAEMTLLSSKERTYSSALAQRIKYIETAGKEDFHEVFASEMGF